MNAMFLDKDNNESLSYDEVKAAMTDALLGQVPSDELLNTCFSKMDASGDGVVRYN